MAKLNYDPRPPERRFDEGVSRADEVADSLVAFGKLLVALGVTTFAVFLLISLLALMF